MTAWRVTHTAQHGKRSRHLVIAAGWYQAMQAVEDACGPARGMSAIRLPLGVQPHLGQGGEA